MPKIISNVDITIKNCAMELFSELSYTNVDMRMISKKSGVAVGTLYNYYKNKKQLYLAILKESWKNTFEKLDIINQATVSYKEKLRKFISILYEDIEGRNGLGKALLDKSILELKDDKEIDELKNSLLLRLENLFSGYEKPEHLSKCSSIDIRLAECLLVSTLTMLELHPNDKENNINFLVEFISLSVKNNVKGDKV
ncbi:TetR/AcrR family transcriptional regulator [Clostridium omnivorum]|uniref:HTH tetR-type domain-containing protein n=1 Tax=Clostridium omnivorum TaxID=1604902 RepID=A0ABQ5N3V8_9CLOT|nr:TetR/AcrR family transcriptional regulator [Clostridium sp. E14]GLC29893.1 hypothetical protein bsdE14_13030 [Clostridium sp. E14]